MDVRTLVDRVEITALSGEFTDAAMMRDFDRVGSLFTADGAWRIPDAGVALVGPAEIAAGITRLQRNWELFVQTVHPGTIRIDGDAATGRTWVHEFGRLVDGSSHQNYAVYHDRYRRTPDGWRFTERTYELRYVDDSALTGAAPARQAGA